MNLSVCSFQKPENFTVSDNSFTTLETRTFTDLKFAENIAKEFRNTCRALDMNVEDLEVVSIITGPGSYTGLRCGFGFIKGLVQGLQLKYNKDAKVFGIDYFELLEFKIKRDKLVIGDNYLILQDARNSRYFYKRGQNIEILDLSVLRSEFASQDTKIFGSDLPVIDSFNVENLLINSETLNDYIAENKDKLINHNISAGNLLAFLPTYVLEPRIG